MDIVLLIARLFLALILGVAGTAKARDLAGTRKALIGFGVPEKLAIPLGAFLPVVEISVALALIPLNTAWAGAVAALSLLLVFAAGIGVNLALGHTPDCNCFGQLRSKPVSWSTFSRNLLLAAIAALIVEEGNRNAGMSALAWLEDLKAGEIVNLVLSLAAVGLLAVAAVYLRNVLNQQSNLLARIEAMKKIIDEDYAEPPVEHEGAAAPVVGLPVGAPAPEFSLLSIGGERVTLDDLLAHGKTVLLLFVSPNCLPCETLLPVVRIWERDYHDHLIIALISKGALEENQNRLVEYGATYLLMQGRSSVAKNYHANWTPAAVLVSSNGRIASQIFYGDEDIRELVKGSFAATDRQLVDGNGNGHRPPISKMSSLKIGDAAPDFSIPDLQGEVVEMKDLIGRDTLLLFWDPGCRFCQAMSDDLRRWEENPPKGAPRLVVVASGDVEMVKASSKNFTSRFLYEDEFEIGPLFGTNSTPSAVLIDREGRIASSMAMGLPTVLALAGVRKAVLPIARTS